MQLTFERGSADRPRGHALVYFQSSNEPDAVLATYVVVPPISMDLAKYVPPMFASQMSGLIPSGPSVFPLPPLPERVDSLDQVRRFAVARDDDVIVGGSIDSTDMQRLLMTVSEIGGEYARLYTECMARLPVEEPEPQEALPSVDVDELFLSVMSDMEKVGRIAKLTGTVRYAVEGSDGALLSETVVEIERIGRHLGDQYRVPDLVRAAQQPTADAGRLTELLVQRCYKLAAEEYGEVRAIEAEIERVRQGN
jgi:hypothetical protein